eukprot:Opistho-2@67949
MPSTSVKTPWKARSLSGRSANRSGRGADMNVISIRKATPSATVPTDGLSRELAARSAALCYTDLPQDVRLRVRQCLLDWIGVTLAGACEPLVHMLAEEAREQGGHAQATPMYSALI